MKERLSTGESRVIDSYKKRGFKIIFKPAWTDFFAFNPDTKQILFVEVKQLGERLSTKQDLSFKALTRVGFEVEVAIPLGDEEVLTLPYEENRDRLRIPKRVFFNAPGQIGVTQKQATPTQILRTQIREADWRPSKKVKPFNPLTDMPTKEEIREIDEKVDKEYEEYLKMLPKQKEIKQEELIDKMEALPEEAISQERWVREEQPSQEEDEKVEERE